MNKETERVKIYGVLLNDVIRKIYVPKRDYLNPYNNIEVVDSLCHKQTRVFRTNPWLYHL